jgi:Cu(I)/Ag(I) efflux system membrane fusion protein
MKNINKKSVLVILGTLLIGLLAGKLFFGGESKDKHNHDKNELAQEKTVWTCSMHPQIRQPEAGDCPICGMDLIPLSNDMGDDENPLAIKMSERAMKLAGVTILVVEPKQAEKQIKLNGKASLDERRVFSQSSHVAGRVESLQINYTGELIQKGQLIANIYSPELINAQEELLQAFSMKDDQASLYQAARAKLINLKWTDTQIDEVVSTKKIKQQAPVFADVSGVVLTKKVNLGDYIKTGQALYEIANLDKVWVLFDVYESDLQWVRKGSKMELSFKAIPGKTFITNVDFVDPIINPKTRVASARVVLQNADHEIKPDMFATGLVQSKANLTANAIVIPKSAVMWTGERSVVYIKEKTASGLSFYMREVLLGADLGDSYVILEGLEQGTEIAVNGTFSIDAAAQLAGKPSMMSPAGGAAPKTHDHGNKNTIQSSEITPKKLVVNAKAEKVLMNILDVYMQLKNSLVNDDFDKAKNGVSSLLSQIESVDMSVFKGDAHMLWMEVAEAMKTGLKEADKANKIEAIRVQFSSISTSAISLYTAIQLPGQPMYVEFCPMANDFEGADWLSLENDIKNPYFGASMLKCGEVKKELNK